SKRLANLAHQPGCQQGVPAQSEEIVLDSNPTQPENFCKQLAQKLFFWCTWLAIPFPLFLTWRWKRFSINFSVGCKRPCRHRNNGRGQHVLRNSLPQMFD